MTNAWVCHPRIPLETYVYFDPLGHAVHTVFPVNVLGEDVLITRAGPIGPMAVAIVRQAGCALCGHHRRE